MFDSLLTRGNLGRVWAGGILLLFGNLAFGLFGLLFSGELTIGDVPFMFWLLCLISVGIAFMALVSLFEARALKYVGYGILIILLGLFVPSGSMISVVRVSGQPMMLQLLLILLAVGSFGFALVDDGNDVPSTFSEEAS